MKKRLLVWETSGVLFIAVFGTSLHFAFELSNFWKPVAIIAAVNESIWEHLKLVFWPGLFTFFPPKIFLFEHIDLMNTGEYGILDNYEDLLIFQR
jgi:hypothetical protein